MFPLLRFFTVFIGALEALPIGCRALKIVALAAVTTSSNALLVPVGSTSRNARPSSLLQYTSRDDLIDEDFFSHQKLDKRFIKRWFAFTNDRFQDYPDLYDSLDIVNSLGRLKPEGGPNKLVTPGVITSEYDPYVKTCFRGVCRSKRNVNNSIKRIVAYLYSVPKSRWEDYEFDHLIPLVCLNFLIPRVWEVAITLAIFGRSLAMSDK
jgi:hypothetical protein